MSDGQVESILDEFRAWLTGNAEAAALPPAPMPRIDLHTLLGQSLALRQEVNLFTKASRAQQELNGDTLQQLTAALDELRRERDKAEQARSSAAEDRQRPLLKTLVELHDSLSLASREVARAQNSIQPLLQKVVEVLEPGEADHSQAVAPHDSDLQTQLPWLARWFGVRPTDTRPLRDEIARLRERREHERLKNKSRHDQAVHAAQSATASLSALLTGYTMSLQRVDRALKQHGLEPIPAVGQVFDPERMEALEAVPGTGRASGEVMDEIRRGYLWNGRIFRFAQVRVAKD